MGLYFVRSFEQKKIAKNLLMKGYRKSEIDQMSLFQHEWFQTQYLQKINVRTAFTGIWIIWFTYCQETLKMIQVTSNYYRIMLYPIWKYHFLMQIILLNYMKTAPFNAVADIRKYFDQVFPNRQVLRIFNYYNFSVKSSKESLSILDFSI